MVIFTPRLQRLTPLIAPDFLYLKRNIDALFLSGGALCIAGEIVFYRTLIIPWICVFLKSQILSFS
jgi:hypothetical protein